MKLSSTTKRYYDLQLRDFTLLMKEEILLGSFWIPSGAHIPLLTSTPFGFRAEKASQTLSA
uniref:Uncharacterized protein n=1 Tax=Arundo donax TaxID=35708 RepID=A0A0A9EAZ9_ARUDO